MTRLVYGLNLGSIGHQFVRLLAQFGDRLNVFGPQHRAEGDAKDGSLTSIT